MLRKNLTLICDKQFHSIILHGFRRSSSKAKSKFEDQSIDEEEVNLHSSLADEWWDRQKNPLHALNKIRVSFIRNCLLNAGLIYSSSTDPDSFLEDLKVLDVGCGGGILTEALGRLRCDVTGIDASAALIEVAKRHAKKDKIVEKQVKYENIDLRSYSSKHPEEFDVIVVSEVLEHVSNKEYFLKLCISCLKDEGSLIITTPNRTAWSKLFLIELAEFLRIVPVNTHDYGKLITPRELTLLLKDLNCTTKHIEGIMYWPWSRKFETSYYHSLMYALHAIKNTDIRGLDLYREDNELINKC